MATLTQAIQCMHGHFSEPRPFGISLCIGGTAIELPFKSCSFERFMFAGHEEMCTALE